MRIAGRFVTRLAATGGSVVGEKLRRPMAHDALDVPRSAEAMTPEWLTAVLCRDHPGAAVVSYSVPSGSSGTSTRAAVRVVYNDAGEKAGLPTELYAKTTTSLTQRLVLGLAQVIDGEIEFFNRIRPRLDIESPRGYFSALDQRTWRSISVIEDVAATKSATFLHATSRISRPNIEGLLAGLAGMHGTMWRDHEVERADTWMKTPLDHLRNISSFISMRKRSAVGAQRARSVIPAPLLGRIDDLWLGFERSMAYATQAPMTFLHGDAHVGNTYITGDGRMGWTDWQVCLRGCWAYDVAYILATALEVEDRRAWERDLLTFYLEHLALAGGQGPEFEEAWQTYRRHLFYPYFAWAFTIGRSALQPKMQPVELCLPIIERTSTAIDDLAALEAVGV